MARAAKITLSDKELSIASDATWILTKWEVMDTVYDLLGNCVDPVRQQMFGRRQVPSMAWEHPPKISKGENYLRLPYVILDYPRQFSIDGVFALRTMFWWAHFFSITLHVSGQFIPLIRDRLLQEPAMTENDLFFCINEDPWQHHFGPENYRLLEEVGREDRIRQMNQYGFVKLALKIDLKNWNRMPALINEGYRRLASFLD